MANTTQEQEEEKIQGMVKKKKDWVNQIFIYQSYFFLVINEDFSIFNLCIELSSMYYFQYQLLNLLKVKQFGTQFEI
jgi:hypothetical protein